MIEDILNTLTFDMEDDFLTDGSIYIDDSPYSDDLWLA